MNRSIKMVAIISATLAATSQVATAQLPITKPPTRERPAMNPRQASAGLSAADQSALNAIVVRHQQMKAALPAEYQTQLDMLTAIVKKRLWAGLGASNLLTSATEIVGATIPALTPPEATAFAEYALAGIAANAPAAGSSPHQAEMQMSFNLQYLQLQTQMQNETRQYTTVSNIMKTKHDTVKNSISNIR